MSVANYVQYAVACGAVCAVAAGAAAQPTLRTVGEVQGTGTRSPYEGAQVAVQGTVVHVATGDCGLGGYFIVDGDGEGDAVDGGASRGLFVYAPDAQVEPGQRLRVEGRVREYQGRTELLGSTAVHVDAGRAVAASPPLTGLDAETLERSEGMRVSIPGRFRVLDNHALGSAGRLALGVERRVAPTQVEFPAGGLPGPPLILDDSCERRDPRPPAHDASAARPLRVGDQLEQIEGVVDEDGNGYRVHALSFDVVVDNPRPAAPPPVSGRLRVVGFNVGRFMGLDAGPLAASQLAKLLSSLVAMDADVLALSEVGHGEGSSALSDLVAGLGDVTAGARDYRASSPERALGDSPIAVALIHDGFAVQALGPAFVLDAGTDARFDDRRNRPALAQHYALLDGGEQVMIAVTHLKSKAGSCASVGDVDVGDGQGACGATRLAAAGAIGDFLAGLSTRLAVPVLLMGDLNSYAAEPPVALLRDAGMSDLIARYLGNGAHTYVYQGAAGYLDHAFASPGLAESVRGVGIWHINADESPMFGAGATIGESTPYRSSDHDPVIVGLFGERLPVLERPSVSGGGAGAAGSDPGVPSSQRPVGEAVGCGCRVGPRGCQAAELARLALVVLLAVCLRRWQRRERGK